MFIASGPRWHRELADKARDLGLLSLPVFELFIELLSFRHFFVHAYSSEIYTERVQEIMTDVPMLYEKFMDDVVKFLE